MYSVVSPDASGLHVASESPEKQIDVVISGVGPFQLCRIIPSNQILIFHIFIKYTLTITITIINVLFIFQVH